MASWTQFIILTNEEEGEYEEVFAHSLGKLAHELGLREPLFKGRMLPSAVGGDMERWLIHATVPGQEVYPMSDDIIFSKIYHSWERGLKQAIEEALARTVGAYEDEIPEDSEFYHYRRHHEESGAPYHRKNRDGTPPSAIQLERMEIHVDFLEANMADMMWCVRNAEIQRGGWKHEAERLRAEVEQLRMERGQLDDEKDNLKKQVDFRDALLLDKDEEVVKMVKRVDELERQLKPPSH